MKEKETIIVVCQPAFQLSKAAIDFLDPDEKKESMIVLMLENAEIALAYGKKSNANQIIRSNIKKSRTEKIFLVSKYDRDTLTEKEHNSLFMRSLSNLSQSYPSIAIEGFIFNGATGNFNVFK